MKRFLFIQILCVAFLLISSVTSTYGADSFKEHYNKGIDFYKQGKYDQAGEEFKQAIELKPTDVYALYGLGNTYYCKAKYDDAVEIYAKAISINPDYAKVHYSLSLAYSKLGMTREAEKQKTIFRKLSQGGESTGSSTPAKASHTSSHEKVDNSPKKTLSSAPKKSLHEVKRTDTHAASGHETKDTHDTPAASGHEAKTHDTRAATARDRGGDSHSTIFKGYSGETHEADKRVFREKPHGTHSFSTKPFSSVKYFIQDKWYSSGINKIWICAAGYIFGTQIWLCVVAFFCVIVWRIRERV
ncbi:MAG: tetratricopeptide repeat protein [Candidatus Scalindua sp.]|nr:tetratricopeptide repeat protein [Candidatus Scalindua sp.]